MSILFFLLCTIEPDSRRLQSCPYGLKTLRTTHLYLSRRYAEVICRMQSMLPDLSQRALDAKHANESLCGYG